MIRRHPSLAQLIALIAVIAAGLAAIRGATPESIRVWRTLFLFSLLIGTLGAILRRDGAAWIGYSLFGWAYALTAHAPPVRDALAPALPEVYWVDAMVIDRIHPPLPEPVQSFPYLVSKEGGVYFKAPLSGGINEAFRPTAAEEKAIDAYLAAMQACRERGRVAWCAWETLHAFFGLAFALFGAMLGRALSNRTQPDGTQPGPIASNPAGRPN